MSLATRCTACGTVFRVVQDQLKVSEGWVRCGRCDEVFNALEGLFDLERDPSTNRPVDNDDGSPSGPVATEGAVDRVEVAEWHRRSNAPVASAPNTGRAMSSHDSGQHSTPARRINERDRLEFPDAQFDPDMLADEALLQQQRAPAFESVSIALDAREAVVTSGTTPEFVRHAQRQVRPRSPWMRALLALAMLVLFAALLLQIVLHHRNAIAGRWPAAAPALKAWCAMTACVVEAPSRIDDVAVESTALTRASAPNTFSLAVVLRNRGALSVALPSVDLSLTDANGQLVARRMLAPHDFHAESSIIKPGGELPLQIGFDAGSALVTGYTVEVFYP